MLLFPLENGYIGSVGNSEQPGGFADHGCQNFVSQRQQMEIFLLLLKQLPDSLPETGKVLISPDAPCKSGYIELNI